MARNERPGNGDDLRVSTNEAADLIEFGMSRDEFLRLILKQSLDNTLTKDYRQGGENKRSG